MKRMILLTDMSKTIALWWPSPESPKGEWTNAGQTEAFIHTRGGGAIGKRKHLYDLPLFLCWPILFWDDMSCFEWVTGS